VEDEVGTASLVRAIVLRHGHGCSVTLVDDALKAMHYLEGQAPWDDREIHPHPDLVILDLGLPGINGFALLDWMDDHHYIADTPVVVFSGTVDPEAAQKAYALGARAFLPKSANPTRLAQVVREMLVRWAPLSRDGTGG
jgi:CheY-like chemotaxis protein